MILSFLYYIGEALLVILALCGLLYVLIGLIMFSLCTYYALIDYLKERKTKCQK